MKTLPNPKIIRLLHRLNGTRHAAVMSSEWVEGSRRRTRSLDVPPYCERIPRCAYDRQPKRIQAVFDAHPRCQSVIAVVDRARVTAFLNALKGCTP